LCSKNFLYSQIIFNREEAIIYDPELDSIARKMNAARLVARAVAHQLLNNVTNLSWSSHPWLNEGLPTFLGTYAIDKVVLYL